MKAFAKWDFSHTIDCFFKRPNVTSFLKLACQCDLASYICKKHPQLTASQLDTLAPGWRSPFEIRQQSNFKIYKREIISNLNSDWRLRRQIKALSLPHQKPAAEVRLPPEQDIEHPRVEIQGPTKANGRISSKFGRMFRRGLFGSIGRAGSI